MLDNQNVEITYTESDSKGRYGASVAGFISEAELTISKVTPQLIIADHTFVPSEFRGYGLAQLLANRLVSDARSNGQRVVPLCPFIRAYAQKRCEELEDVIQW